MLGSRLVTKQTDQIGLPINLVYIEIGIQIKREFYLSLVIDRSKESWTFIGSSEGGVDIEMVADLNKELKSRLREIKKILRQEEKDQENKASNKKTSDND